MGKQTGTTITTRMPLVALLELEEGEEAQGGEPVRKRLAKLYKRNSLVTSREVGWCLPGRAGRRDLLQPQRLCAEAEWSDLEL